MAGDSGQRREQGSQAELAQAEQRRGASGPLALVRERQAGRVGEDQADAAHGQPQAEQQGPQARVEGDRREGSDGADGHHHRPRVEEGRRAGALDQAAADL
jgi:hypothetical protein